MPGMDQTRSSPLGLSTSQAANALGVSLGTIRRWADMGYLESYRTPGGQRRYTRYEIRVIQQVVSMADEGITLQAIRRIIELERQLAAVTRERDELARRLAGLLGT